MDSPATATFWCVAVTQYKRAPSYGACLSATNDLGPETNNLANLATEHHNVDLVVPERKFFATIESLERWRISYIRIALQALLLS